MARGTEVVASCAHAWTHCVRNAQPRDVDERAERSIEESIEQSRQKVTLCQLTLRRCSDHVFRLSLEHLLPDVDDLSTQL